MWKAKTGEQVDGVFAIDPLGLQALIEVSGPVMVGGKLITKDNVIHETLLQSYLDYELDQGDPTRCQAAPRPGASARATSPARSSTSSTSKGWDVAKLVEDLQTAAQGRHVMAWSSIRAAAARMAGRRDLGPAPGGLAAGRAPEPAAATSSTSSSE